MTGAPAPPPGSEPVVPPWIFRFINPWMRPLLESRFRGPLGRRVLVMTYRGRRTGRLMTHPALFYPWADREVIVYSSTRWWLNLLAAPDVELLIDGRHWQARPHVIRTREEVVKTVAEFIGRVGLWPARIYRMGLPWLHSPTEADIANVRRGFVFVRFELGQPTSRSNGTVPSAEIVARNRAPSADAVPRDRGANSDRTAITGARGTREHRGVLDTMP